MDSKDNIKNYELFGMGNEINPLVSIGLIKFIESLKEKLLSEVNYPNDYPPEWPILGSPSDNYKNSLYNPDFPFYLKNELFLNNSLLPGS